MRRVSSQRGVLNCLILENGLVRTMELSMPPTSGLSVAGDRIVALGPGLSGPEIQRIDLSGGCVLPGFTDAHVHFPTWSLARREVRLEGTPIVIG
jgi:predicted amidohydrolase YtcJ